MHTVDIYVYCQIRRAVRLVSSVSSGPSGMRLGRQNCHRGDHKSRLFGGSCLRYPSPYRRHLKPAVFIIESTLFSPSRKSMTWTPFNRLSLVDSIVAGAVIFGANDLIIGVCCSMSHRIKPLGKMPFRFRISEELLPCTRFDADR
jgi:hypothetical protein